ncbi:MAG: response regulator [Acidobacteria bacterium]|nr:response regulator [Acidobacteriota bacterium]
MAEDPRDPGEGCGTGRVLVVDDSALNQLVVSSLLAALGLRADVVAGGAVALERLATAPYDLVLMDCEMPGMDGWEATRRYREGEAGSRTPIIALTASSTEADMALCRACGMDDFLSKPIDLQVLAAMLAKHLGRG